MQIGLSSKKRSWKLSVLAVCLVFMGLLVFQDALIDRLSLVSAPLSSLATRISETHFWWQLSRELTDEDLTRLYEQRQMYSLQAAEVEQLREENQLLKDELGFVTRTKTRVLTAQVLGKSISNASNRFLIDVGSDEGAYVGAAVVSGDGIFVGTIQDLDQHSSTVLALTDPNSSIAVSVLNERRTIGVASGSTAGLLQINFIPIDENITENNLVVTSGLNALIPSGLLIGIINSIQTVTGAPFKQAIVEPLSDVRRLSLVLVITLSEDQS